MRVIFSWDDGAPQDKKMYELHEKYKIPGMFFVPTKNREGRDVISSNEMKNAESSYVSFGGHTENHVYLTELSIDDVEKEIVNNKKYLEDLLGHEILHFCFPGGQYTDEIMNIASKYYKTLRTADTMNFAAKHGILLKPAFHFYPRGYKSLIGNGIRQKSVKQTFNIALLVRCDYFDTIKKMIKNQSNSDSDIMIWGHSWEIEELNLWNKLEDLFVFLKENFYYCCCKYDDLLN